MKKFTKLVLATSVAFSANAMAMQAMDDASLSETTGQDGISIGIGISKIEIEKLFIHDNDGLNGTISNAGAIVIKGNGEGVTAAHGVVIGANYADNGAHLLTTKNLADLQIDSDAGDVNNGGAFLNIAAQVSGLKVNIGEIGVTASGTQDLTKSLRRGGNDNNYNAILSGLEIVTGKMDANIQVGAAPQGAMIKLNTTMTGGLEIKNLGLLDNSTKGKAAGFAMTSATSSEDILTSEAGEIFIESIKVADANDNDLTINSDIQIFNDAVGALTGEQRAAHLRIVSNDTGTKDQYIKGIHLGSRNAGSIGDMEVQGLQTYWSPSAGTYTKGAVITISGR